MTDTVDAPTDAAEAPSAQGGNGIGITAFVTGSAGLGPIAILLGAVGLARWRAGAASRRSWPLAGLVLGAVGTVAAVVGGVVVATSGAAEAEVDARAQVDIINVGNAAVAYAVANPTATEIAVAVTDGGYEVVGAAMPASLDLDGDRDLSIVGTTAYDWCVTLTYVGGEAPSVAYAAAQGLVETCDAG